MRVGVVIVTYNRLELLKQCIENCVNQTIQFEKIVVINNCSTDGTNEYLMKYADDERFVIANQKSNLGGSGGFKEGLKIIREYNLDWVLIIDDDAIINTNYIEECLKYARKHPDVCACSGTVFTNGEIQYSHRRIIKNKLLMLEVNVSASAYNHSGFKYDLSTFCGLLVRGDILKEVGLPKSEYFIWYDDTEFSMRLLKYSKIVNINSAHLDHRTILPSDEKKGFFARMNWRTYYGHRNRLDAVKMHCGKMTQAIILTEFIVFIMCGYIMQLSRKKREQGKYIVAMLKDAMLDGYTGRLGKNEKYFPHQ